MNRFLIQVAWVGVAASSLCWAASPPADSLRGLTPTIARKLRHSGIQGRWLLQCQISGVSGCALARGTERSQRFQLDCTYCRDGERLDVRTTRKDDGNPVRCWRSIVDGWYLSYQVPPAGELAVSGVCSLEGSAFAGAALPSAWGPFEGYAAGDYLPFTDILRSVEKLESSEQVVNGFRCVLLKGSSQDYGSYQVWLDPAADYLPRKVLVDKTSDNYWGGVRLRDWAHLAPHGSKGTAMLRSITYSVDQVRLEEVQGHWFPLTCRVERVNRYSDNNVERIVMECRRTRLELEPDFHTSGAFVPQLQQGAHLANLVDSHLPYQWKGGAPAPLVDNDVVAQMDRAARMLKQELDRNGGSGTK